jgi:hypothetical protein
MMKVMMASLPEASDQSQAGYLRLQMLAYAKQRALSTTNCYCTAHGWSSVYRRRSIYTGRGTTSLRMPLGLAVPRNTVRPPN